ncbi:MAG: four helix bundle protein [Anaerolinea sp.]|nr:four helix bundle protein [Anaerolinea sp.]
MSNDSLNKLLAWKEAKNLALLVYRNILPDIPSEEKWGIGIQLRRASQSISTNIAEGFGRYYYQDMVRFCYIARGSLEETISLVALSYELGFIRDEKSQLFIEKSNQVLQLINGYISYLKKSILELKTIQTILSTLSRKNILKTILNPILNSQISILPMINK